MSNVGLPLGWQFVDKLEACSPNKDETPVYFVIGAGSIAAPGCIYEA